MEASAYYAAFRLLDTIASLISCGALSNAMIPVLLGVCHTEGDTAEQRLVNLAATTLTVAVVLIVLICIVFAPFLVRVVIAPGFDSATAVDRCCAGAGGISTHCCRCSPWRLVTYASNDRCGRGNQYRSGNRSSADASTDRSFAHSSAV